MSKFLLFLMLIPSFAFAKALQSSSHIPYYGEDFYATPDELAQKGYLDDYKADPSQYLKSLLFFVLDSNHCPRSGHYDVIIKDNTRSGCYAHSPYNYSTEAKEILFNYIYNISENDGTNSVIDVYCHRIGNYRIGSTPKKDSINVEHTWPRSKFKYHAMKYYQTSDLHHLFPTDAAVNNDRANFPFGDVQGGGYPTQDYCPMSRMGEVIPVKGLRADKDQLYFEPPQEQKGNTARAMFYFSIRYKMPIDPIQEYYLRRWHKEDPVDRDEREVNNRIFKVQKTRNPFIDYPDLVEQIRDF